MSHLERITSRSFNAPSEVDNVREMVVYSGVLFLRPFKLFMLYETEIRQSLQEVETMVRRQTEVSSEETGDNQEFDNNDLLEDLKLLIKFFDEDLKPTFDLRLKIQVGSATDIEYPDLWHLFRRGDFVMSQSNREQAYQVINYSGGRDPLVEFITQPNEKVHPVNGFTLDCCNLGFDGNSYVPKLEKFSIRKFPGRQPITSLSVYPLRFDSKADRLRSTFLDRGVRFLQLTSSPFSHKMLTGKTLDEPSHDMDAQVVIDMTLAININPIWRPKTEISEDDLTEPDGRETRSPTSCKHMRGTEGCCGSDYIFKDLEIGKLDLSTYLRENSHLLSPRKGQDLKEEERILLPYWVYGFVLRTRQWITLRIEDLSEVKFENDFDELLLPDSHKQTVQALVKTHENARSKSSTGTSSVGAGLDLVKGKGTGLIILLHGEPGRYRPSGRFLQCALTAYRVGKTSTAECVADDTKRPLFPITCGDIGETATEVENNLHRNFRLAHKWGCVLLLDEADVFLAKRNRTDLRRNAVTSVFLRSLEYYAGILFLTTNRVGGIDPAFKSRIHMSLLYLPLDESATLKLYEVFIKRAKAEQERSGSFFKIKEKEILRFAKRHFQQLKKEGFGTWNGR
jgi:hypothetical protein